MADAPPDAPRPTPTVLRPVAALGRAAIDTTEFVGGVALLGYRTAVSSRHLVTSKKRGYEIDRLAEQMVRVGVRSVPIVCLVLFCIGAILSLQIAPVLDDYGAVDQLSFVIGVSMFRELGPLIGAVVLTGYAGASIAAELGTMVVGEEIEALEVSAIHPVRFLVVPRVLATTVMMVGLAAVADVVGLAGGAATAKFAAGLSARGFVEAAFESITLTDFVTGLIKAAVFGALISGLACYLGLKVKGGAEGVGDATTRTVVLTIVALILVDLAFTTFFYTFGF